MAIEMVLVVDDSPTELLIISRYLTRHGYGWMAAKDGEEAIVVARKHKPDLILMDIVMPGMNGYQATRTLSKDPETADIPILMITSKNQETDRLWGIRQGAIDYLVKPVSESDLIDRIRAL